MAKQWWEEGSRAGANDGSGSIGFNNTNEQYKNNLNSMYKHVMEYKPFQYDLDGDPVYRQMADRYSQMGKTAMRDTMGTAAGLTGGYGNSWAQHVGQQAYQQYLTALSDQVPELYSQAYSTWEGDFDRLLQLYELTAAHPEYMAALTPSTGGSGTGNKSSSGGFKDLFESVGALGGNAAIAAQIAAAGLPSISSKVNPLDNWYYQLLTMTQ